MKRIKIDNNQPIEERFDPSDKRQLASGMLLVANPLLTQRGFDHAVILLLDYGKHGAMGCVLNYSTNIRLAELLNQVSEERNIPVYMGGPVGMDRLFFLHTLGPDILAGANRIADGMWVGGDYDAAIDYVNADYEREGLLRFFLGYAGWDSGQLEGEIDEGTWAILPLPMEVSELLSGEGDAVWHRAVRDLGPQYRKWQLYPRNVHMN